MDQPAPLDGDRRFASSEGGLLKPVLLISVAVWFGFLFLYTGFWIIEGALPPDLLQRAIVYSYSAALTFLAGNLVFIVLATGFVLRWAVVLLIAVSTLFLHAVGGTFVAFLTWPASIPQQPTFFQVFSTAMIYDSAIVSSAFIGFTAIHFGRQLSRQQRLSLETANAAREAQLAALRHQLNPHFLFNTLNSISALVTEGDKENAEKTLLLLSEFLRFSLDSDPVALIPLEEELASVDKYLQIEQVRYEDRLHVTTTIDPAARGRLVPPFLLQPLLENVIKHAVSKVGRQISVNVACTVSEDILTISVEDDGPGVGDQSAGEAGTGLTNLRARLRLTYGPAAMMRVEQRRPQGVRIVIEIARAAHA